MKIAEYYDILIWKVFIMRDLGSTTSRRIVKNTPTSQPTSTRCSRSLIWKSRYSSA